MNSSLYKCLRTILRTRLGRWSLALLLFLSWVWIGNIPLIRLSYGGVVLPWRSLQYYLSVHKTDAVNLQDSFFSALGSGKDNFFRRVGIWSVLKSMREESLSIEDQAIILAIVWQESRFLSFAKNKDSSACGLYQLVAATGLQHELKWWRCMDPVANARAGTALYRRYKVKSPAFAERLRCSYLKHYYGRASGCGSDPAGIWKRVGSSMVKRANLALRTLTAIKVARQQESILSTVWRFVDPYVPLALIVMIFLFFRKVTSPKKQARK